jgi:hypothetical protein
MEQKVDQPDIFKGSTAKMIRKKSEFGSTFQIPDTRQRKNSIVRKRKTR